MIGPPEIRGRTCKAGEHAAVIGKDHGGVTGIPDARALDIAVAVIGLAGMSVELADHLQLVFARRLDARRHSARLNMEAARRGHGPRPEHGGRQHRDAVGAPEKIDDAFMALAYLGLEPSLNGVETGLRKNKLGRLRENPRHSRRPRKELI